MRKIAVIGTGYVGLVTGVCLSEIGHDVTCVDMEKVKVEALKKGKSPIFEPGLDELILKNMRQNRLAFTTNHKEAFSDVEVIYLAVGTPEREDGSADLSYLFQAAEEINSFVTGKVIIVIKSTVPVGTNEKLKQFFDKNNRSALEVSVVSNPEFLREGQAIYDTFHGDRIVIGTDCDNAADIITEINEPFQVPIIRTNSRSAELIKYASNAFLATKISFINEISNICEKLGADIEDVAFGMGQDSRIGTQFLNAGIGYGGSCFPKDTKALVQIAGGVKHKFELLESVIRVNNEQQLQLIKKAKNRFTSLRGLKVALLGLSFKPNTDDIREAASIVMAKQLIQEGSVVVTYDPKAIKKTKEVLGNTVLYTSSIRECLEGADVAFIATEWEEIKNISPRIFEEVMKTPIIFDGRNCYTTQQVKQFAIEYHSIGRPVINNLYPQLVSTY